MPAAAICALASAMVKSPKMKNRGRQYGAGTAFADPVDQVIKRPDTARRDDRHLDRVGDRACQGQVETGSGSVLVHGGQKDLTGPFFGNRVRKFHGIDPRWSATTMGKDLPPARFHGLGVYGDNNALASELVSCLCHHIRVGDGGGIETDLVSPGQQEVAYIHSGSYAAAHRQRNKALFSRALNHVEHRATVFMGGVDIEETEFICARFIIGSGAFDRIPGIDEVDKVDTFDHAPVGNIKAGNDTGLQHGGVISLARTGASALYALLLNSPPAQLVGCYLGGRKASRAVARSSAPS